MTDYMVNPQCFNFWCYSVLPLVYDDSLTYYEIICKIVDYVNAMVEDEKALAKVVEKYGVDIATMQTEIDKVNKELDDFKSGKALGIYLDALSKWINENLQKLVARIAKFVIFGLDNRGYFYADIPDSWDSVSFTTIADYSDENFGSLVLELTF